jgi:hypothetical protein
VDDDRADARRFRWLIENCASSLNDNHLLGYKWENWEVVKMTIRARIDKHLPKETT